MPEGKSIKISEKNAQKCQKGGGGSKLTNIYLKWINFDMDKISRTATSVDSCVV